MNLLDIDFKSMISNITDAFTTVYGEKYRELINKKLNNTYFISYFDIEGLKEYINYLKFCKSRELSIKFLEEIGISVNYDKSNYTKALDIDTSEILDSTIDTYYAFSSKRNQYVPLLAFDNENHEQENDILQNNRLKLINYFLREKNKKITIEDLPSFMATDEYLEILNKIKKYKTIYDKLFQEFSNWEKSLESYETFIKKEEDKRNEIYKRKKQELFQLIYDKLPKKVKEAIQGKDIEEQQKIILGDFDITSPSLIESFSKNSFEELTDSNNNIWKKITKIGIHQVEYLKHLKITLPFNDAYDCNNEEKLSFYLDFLKQEKIQQYIPSQDVISFIENTRKEKMEEAYLEYLSNRSDYQKIANSFSYQPDFLNTIRNIIQKKMILVTLPYAIDKQGNIISFLCYSVRKNAAGYLDYLLLHECGHAIEKTEKGCGLGPEYTYNNDLWYNPYDNNFRIYEKINENLNDIFTLEALDYLHKNDIYLLEPKEIVQQDCQDKNTYMITKKILYPLLEKFREEVIAAKLNVNPSILTQCIGEDNYEALVDVVNKVDYLCRNDLEHLLKYYPDTSICKEYQKQLERANEIYNAIDEYSAKRDSNASNLEKKQDKK